MHSVQQTSTSPHRAPLYPKRNSHTPYLRLDGLDVKRGGSPMPGGAAGGVVARLLCGVVEGAPAGLQEGEGRGAARGV